MTTNTFGCHISTVAKIIKDVSCAIACKLGQKYVHLTQTKNAVIEKAPEFEAKYGMHKTFGCIDGAHVAIIKLFKHSQDFFCYKQFFKCVDDQAVCDFCGLFIDVDCRWPVGVYDGKVFGNSFISQKLRDEKLPEKLHSRKLRMVGVNSQIIL